VGRKLNQPRIIVDKQEDCNIDFPDLMEQTFQIKMMIRKQALTWNK